MVKTLSMGSRGLPRSRRGWAFFKTLSMVAFSSSKPCPVTAETATTGAPAKRVGRIKSSISIPTKVVWSWSARSDWVMTMIACGTSMRSRIARCSRVCGLMDSLAATTSKAKSMPLTPASIFLMKCSWPGTSITLTSRPLGSVNQAKPSSMVISRAFSSASRSGSMPVRACTNVDLP